MRTREQLMADLTAATGVSESLRLPLGSQLWKGQAGEFRGAGVGSSVDFQDHREYSPGDDPRHINWQAYARTGQYTMKLYREEVRPVVDLFVDCSQSMWSEPGKSQRTSELVYFLASSAQRVGASLQMSLILGDSVRPLTLESLMTHRWMDEMSDLASIDPASAPQLDLARGRSNAIRVLVSDLLFEGDPAPVIRSLKERQGSGLIFCPFTRQEADPEWTGHYDFIDAERGSHHNHQISPGVLTRYLAAYRAHFGIWEEECRRHQVGFSRIAAHPDLFTALHEQAVRSGLLELSP